MKLIVANSKEVSHAPTDRRSYDKPSGSSRHFAIYPTAVPDTYVYERSVSSKSDFYSTSDIMSDDTDSIDEPIFLPLFSHNSSSSSSSTEALPDTALLEYPTEQVVAERSRSSSRSPSPPTQRSSAANTHPRNHSQTPVNDARVVLLTSKADYASSRPLPTPPIPFNHYNDSAAPAGERVTLSDGTTYVRPRLPSSGLGDRPSGLAPTQRHRERQTSISQQNSIQPGRRSSPEAGTIPSQKRQTPVSRDTSLGIPPPPGLGNVELPEDTHALSDSPEPYQSRFSDPHVAVMPQRRNSDGDQSRVLLPKPVRSNTAPPTRSVRWNDNLICPSPIHACQRRKGWFNRRGDQLWTNDGAYKPPAPGQEYPIDLDGYPEPPEGWQNEEGVRIDIRHRLIPKVPLRSALKRPRPQEQIAGYITGSDNP
ncbi:hypothetical protein SERLADRAFT_456766 [Serpula lacrymans var. lacrymans S7.9]|nr:uncharacterized protein SERLADRAFT_456766 [Serpula lacrymans var. lacrymans S7.9]EGO29248.1 hypothetical protein SERLADRAFT_456766 [Serpula lacrymans var. lacrymans S7.9]